MSVSADSTSLIPHTSDSPAESVAQQAGEGTLSEKGIVAVTALGHFLCHLSENVYPGVMMAVIAQFGLSNWQGTSLFWLGAVLLGVGAIPVGMLADRWGAMRMFRIYFLFTAVSAILVAISPNAWSLVFSLTLLGLAASIYHPVGLVMISLGVRARGRAMGLNGMAGNVGIALGPALGLAFGFVGWWRVAYILVAILSFVSFGLFWLLTRNVNLDCKKTGSFAPEADEFPNQDGEPKPNRDLRKLLVRIAPLVLLYAAMVFGGLNYRYLMTALPAYVGGKEAADALKKKVTSPSTKSATKKNSENETDIQGFRFDYLTAIKVFIALIIGGIGQYVGGWLGDRFGARYMYPALIACVLPMGILVAIGEGSAWVWLPAGFLAMSMFGQQPVENSLLAEKTRRGRRGLSYATKFTLSFGIGGALGIPITGLVWQYTGSLGSVFLVIAGSAVVMCSFALAALLIKDDNSDKHG